VSEAGRKGSMFEGLEDDLPPAGDLFVPRTSIKKLVLRTKVSTDVQLPVLEKCLYLKGNTVALFEEKRRSNSDFSGYFFW
jgi:hypothetical protein